MRVIHESDHSRVYLAETVGGVRAALKELVYVRALSAKVLDDFDREAKLLREIDHPAIPRLINYFTEGKQIRTRNYLASESVEGETLLSRLDHHRFTVPEVSAIARDTLVVPLYLHGLSPPIIHRDIKPENLIVRPGGTIALERRSVQGLNKIDLLSVLDRRQ